MAEKPGPRPRVNQAHRWPAKLACHLLGGDQVSARWAQRVGLRRRGLGLVWPLAGIWQARHGASRGLPGLQTTVKHRNRHVPQPLQHPPEAAAVICALAVIDHCLHARAQAHTAKPVGKGFAGWEGVAPARSGICGALGGAQVAVEVGAHCPGNVRFAVLLLASTGLHQLKAAVKDQAGLAAGQ